MFFLESLAILQIAVLPGALFLKLTSFKGGVIQRLVFTFGLSLIGNYCFVLLLTVVGLYRQEVMLALFFIECLALAWLYRLTILSPLGPALVGLWKTLASTIRDFVPLPKSGDDDTHNILEFFSSLVTLIFVILAVTIIWWVVKQFLYNLGTVFDSWDSLMAYNRWAVEWAGNQLPTHTRRYPQLIPINWSLSYVFSNDTSLQFFAKGLHPIFALGIFLLIFDLGLSTRKSGYFIGAVLAYMCIRKFEVAGITNGYMDMPAAFFVFLVIYTLLKASSSLDENSRRQGILLGLLFAGGAAVTKQVGIYVLMVVPLLVYLILLRPFYKPVPKEMWRLFLISLIVAMLVSVPWYLYKQVIFFRGLEIPETDIVLRYTSAAYDNSGLFEQVSGALLSLDKYIWLLVFLVPALFVLDWPHRWIVLLIVFPFTLIWAGFASYNTRNLTLVFPLLGMTAGMGIQQFFHLGLRFLKHLKVERLKMVFLPVLVLLTLALGSFLLPAAQLQDRQVTLQKQIFSPSMNKKLYNFFDQVGLNAKVLTDYPIRLLPDLENNQIKFNFNDYDLFLTYMDDPDIEYMLVPRKANRQVLRFIAQKIISGDYEVIFEDKSWIPYTLLRILRH